MDKNFFMFDIDDEIRQIKTENDNCEKPQNSIKLNEKVCKNSEKLNIFIAKRTNSNSGVLYQKQLGLKVQREIKSNITMVQDLVNFDFRAREKQLENIDDFQNQVEVDTISNFDIVDGEVEKVIEKAQIGVIFY